MSFAGLAKPRVERALRDHETVLDLVGLGLTELPESLRALKFLKRLNAAGNRITALPDWIGELANLRHLDIARNRLTELPETLGKLEHLSELHIDDNLVSELPVALGTLKELTALSIHGNPLPNELLQVLQRQNLDGLLAWLREQAADLSMPEAKVLVIGEGAVGKTSLVAQLSGRGFVQRPRTHGIEIGTTDTVGPDGNPLTLRFWDFGGQDHYRATHQLFFTPDTVYVVVWNGRHGTLQDRVAEHLERIRLRVGPSASVILVATHTGVSDRADYDLERLQRSLGGPIRGVVEVDNLTGRGVAELSVLLAGCAAGLNHMRRRWSAAAANFRDALGALAKERAQISWTEFAELGVRHGLESGAAEQVAIRLAVMGRLTFYHDQATLSGRVILQPEFLTTAIAYVLDHQPTKDNGGVITHQDLLGLWMNPPDFVGSDVEPRRFERSDFSFLVELMQHHGISFQLEDSESSLIGQLVPERRPSSLGIPEPLILSAPVRRLAVRLGANGELPGLIAGLIVRNHPYKTGLWWRHGVVLHHVGSGAWALLALQDSEVLTLTVWDDHPDSFFYRLRASIEAVLAQWPHLSPQYAVACPTRVAARRSDPVDGFCGHSWDFAHLERFRGMGVDQVPCGECGTIHSTSELLGQLDQGPTIDSVTHEILGRLNTVSTAQELLLAGQQRLERLGELDFENSAMMLSAIFALVTTEVSEVPRLFSIEKLDQGAFNPKNWVSEAYNLRLWCEFPDDPHPAPKAYRFTRSRDWYKQAGPYLRLVSLALRLAPVARGVLSVAANQYGDKSHESEVLTEIQDSIVLTERIAALATGEVRDQSAPSTQHNRIDLLNPPEMRHLRQLIRDIGAATELGGLRRVPISPTVASASTSIAPDGRYYFLCDHHYREWVQGPPELPGTG